MGVRAKFWVNEVTRTASGGRVKLGAVCRGEDNKAWSAATPTGSIEMGILNDAALDDFTPAPKGEEGMGE